MTVAPLGTVPLVRSVVGFFQPAAWRARATVADPALPHQIQIHIDAVDRLVVGCNCTTSLGRIDSLSEAWDLYWAHLPHVQGDCCGSCGDPVRQDHDGRWAHVNNPRDIGCDHLDTSHLDGVPA